LIGFKVLQHVINEHSRHGGLLPATRSAGASVDVKIAPETLPIEIAKAGQFKLDQAATAASVAVLGNYDAVIVKCPTRFGRIPSQMDSVIDQADGLWVSGALNGKVAAPSPRRPPSIAVRK
jgi:multimeric flavodoxin WrbA